MKKINFLIITLLINFSSHSSYWDKTKEWAKKINKYLTPVYDTDNLYTGAMAMYCFMNPTDVTTLISAGVQVIAAATYDPEADQRCFWIPREYNWAADLLASASLGGHNITGTTTEALIRSGVNSISTAATIRSTIPSEVSIDYGIDFGDLADDYAKDLKISDPDLETEDNPALSI